MTGRMDHHQPACLISEPVSPVPVKSSRQASGQNRRPDKSGAYSSWPRGWYAPGRFGYCFSDLSAPFESFL